MISLYAGLTSQTIDVFIQDSTATNGSGKTGLAFNTASLVAYYRKGATGTATAITLATQTVGGAYSSGGFVEIDATNMPGLYRLDLPNAAIDTSGFVSVMLKGATGMAPTVVRIDCRALPGDIKLFGGTAGTFASGRPEVNTSHIAGSAVSTTTAQIGVNVVQVSGDSVAADNLEAAADGTGYNLGNGSIVAASVTGAVGSVTGAVGSVTGNVGGNVTGSVGSVAAGGITASSIAADAIGASELAADAVAEIADAVWDEVLSGHLTAGTTGNALNAAGSAGDPWSTTLPGSYTGSQAGKMLSDILTDTAEIGSAGAGLTALASAANLATLTAYVDTEIAAILADTNELQTDWANGGRLDLLIDAILDDTGTSGVAIASGGITASTIATGAIDADAIAADAVAEIWGTALTEAYRGTGATGTGAQLLYEIVAHLGEFAITSTTKTLKKLDGSTTAKTFTLDSATTPTSITETT